MKTEAEIHRYLRLMMRGKKEAKTALLDAQCDGAIATAGWILGIGSKTDPPGYAALLAQDKADDKRMDRQ